MVLQYWSAALLSLALLVRADSPSTNPDTHELLDDVHSASISPDTWKTNSCPVLQRIEEPSKNFSDHRDNPGFQYNTDLEFHTYSPQLEPPAIVVNNSEDGRVSSQQRLDSAVLASDAIVAVSDSSLQSARALENPMQEKLSKRGTPYVYTYWLPKMALNGTPPMGYDPSYPVYRDVTKFGAKGDGVTDDTDAINNAIAANRSCVQGCETPSVMGIMVYFPPGTYLITSTIQTSGFMQIIGDVITLPTILTAKNFTGAAAISTAAEPNIFLQIRNFNINISQSVNSRLVGIQWQVAQATSLFKILITASTANNTAQVGLLLTAGSGGFMSDVSISGGAYGVYGGGQQFTARGFIISGQSQACIALTWGLTSTWIGLQLAHAPIGVDLSSTDLSQGQRVGSMAILDTFFAYIPTAVLVDFNQDFLVNSSIVALDNIQASNVTYVLAYADGPLLNSSGKDNQTINSATIGPIEDAKQDYGVTIDLVGPRRPALVWGPKYDQTFYFVTPRPQYWDWTVQWVISVKDQGAKGDGKTDDTAAIQRALDMANTSTLVFFPAGSYIVTSTVTVKTDTYITGQVWSQLVASGPYFGNETSPQPMIRVGSVGENGTVQISDMLFTSRGSTPGLVLMEWNMAASIQGSNGMWDSHFRLGGAYGTNLSQLQCGGDKTVRRGCMAASLMLHVTPSASGYFENVWAWAADYDMDNPKKPAINVASARGILIESEKGPNWLVGTSSEHSMMYQYNFATTSNVFAAMLQAETPRFQGRNDSFAALAPGPFVETVGIFNDDPLFLGVVCNGSTQDCAKAWGVTLFETIGVYIAGAVLRSLSNGYNGSCVDKQDCQVRMFLDDGHNRAFYLLNLMTIGVTEMISNSLFSVSTAAHGLRQVWSHPFYSGLAAYLLSSESDTYICSANSTDPACTVERAPCTNMNFQSYTSLADLSDQTIESLPAACQDVATMIALVNMANASVNNYTNIQLPGFDKVLGNYQDAMKSEIPAIISNYVAQPNQSSTLVGPGSQYFDCTMIMSGRDPIKQPCPFNFTAAGIDSIPEFYTINFTFTNETGFWQGITALGLNTTWVQLGSTQPPFVPCIPVRGGVCEDKGTGFTYNNYPMASSTIVIPDPSVVVQNAMPGIKSMIQNAEGWIYAFLYTGTTQTGSEAVASYSPPVFAMQQSVDNMASAKEMGQKIASEKKKDLILTIIGAILFFVPFLDDLGFLAALPMFFEVVSDAAQVAMTLASVVQNPSMAPFAILGFLGIGAGVAADAGVALDSLANVAKIASAITPTVAKGFGTVYEAGYNSLKTILTRFRGC